MFFYHRTYEEYRRLKREVDSLKSRLIGLDEILQENQRYEQLLNFKRSLVYSSVAANVIGRDPTNFNQAMIIDRGERDGLTIGMPVVNAQGVVGKIAEVGQKTSKIILLTDPQFSVAAVLQGLRVGGVVSGTLQGICRMRYLSSSQNMTIGDKVVTSQLSSSFPEGLLIGEVVAIKTNENRPTVECLIKPSVSFFQVEEVLIIKGL